MTKLVASIVLLASITHAFDLPAQGANGNGTVPPSSSEVFNAANRAANTSHSVTFQHFHDNTDHDIPDTNLIWKDWTWTVNTSDVSLPNASNSIPSAHVTYTTYSFAWPGNGDINAALRAEVHASNDGRAEESCGYIFGGLFPLQISNSWDASSSDCTSALGKDCVSAIMTQLHKAGSEARPCSLGGLSLIDPSFKKACAASFGADQSKYGPSVTAVQLGNSSDSAASQSSLQQGDTFYWQIDEPYAAGNVTIYNRQASALHVMGLSRGAMDNVQLLCNRASATPLAGAAARVSAFSITLPAVAVAAVLAMVCLQA